VGFFRKLGDYWCFKKYNGHILQQPLAGIPLKKMEKVPKGVIEVSDVKPFSKTGVLLSIMVFLNCL
jgi:hypothetical protein